MTSRSHVWTEHTLQTVSMPSPCCCSFKLHRKPCSADTAVSRQLVSIRCSATVFPTLSLSTVFWDVLDAIEMVSGWLLPSPWLSPSSPPSLQKHTAQPGWMWKVLLTRLTIIFYTFHIIPCPLYVLLVRFPFHPAETAKLALLMWCTCDVTEWVAVKLQDFMSVAHFKITAVYLKPVIGSRQRHEYKHWSSFIV